MNTEEMFRRGQADAEADTLNAFYYRHYFPYRRGYDQTRRRLLRPGVVLPGQRHLLVWGIGILLLGLAAVWAWPLLQPAPVQPTSTVVAIVPTVTRIPTRTPIFPTNTPQPTRTATPVPEFGKGKTAIVTTAGLRARLEPTTDSRVVITFREGDRVTILDGPRNADGYIWWQIEGNAGSGWSAERSAEGVQWLRLEQ